MRRVNRALASSTRLTVLALACGLVGLAATSTHAAGGFECTSQGGFVWVRGTNSSAGTSVTDIRFGEREVLNFQAGSLYINDHRFSFLALDENYNKRVLRVETIATLDKGDYVTSGFAWVGEQEDVAPITCAFSY